MTALHEAIGRRRRTLYVPAPEESVQQSVRQADNGRSAAPATPSDPPIYRALVHHWAARGMTLPGSRDPEWARLAAPTVRTGQFGSTTPFNYRPAHGVSGLESRAGAGVR
ncbi:hypothetical protein ACFQVC_25735 [Streptomyces monticola]|uniref:Uncharacterized protein n=1 Tax=Streptomyces monticola TaxID=2666263 RepID=A0ABW2JP83_9ACTN